MDNKINFDKPALTIEEQVSLLRSRNMKIKDEEYARKCLFHIGYYRLSGYWFKYQDKSTEKNLFKENISFEEVINFYRFDSKLRSLILDALEKIEISISTHISYYMCNTVGPYWYEDFDNYQCEKESFDNTIAIINEELKKSSNKKNKILKDFHNKYSNENPPFWMVDQFLAFGQISHIFSYLKKEDKQRIAMAFEMNIKFFQSSLHVLSYIRNICAHYSRLYDKKISIKPKNIALYNTSLDCFSVKFGRTDRLYPIFYIISLYLLVIDPKSKFCTLIKNLIDKYKELSEDKINYKDMGFPENWENQKLFEIMLKNK